MDLKRTNLEATQRNEHNKLTHVEYADEDEI